MTIEDKVIMGSDLCNSECIERNNIIHPETCLGQVKLTDSNGLSLYDWINNNANNPVEYYSSLKDWLDDNYSSSGSDIPIATTTRIGGVKIDDEYLTINGEGLLGVDVEALPSHEEHNASFDTLGSVKLGNDTIINEDFGNGTITIDDFYKFPLRSDINNRTGIAIPKSLFNGTQADWNENDISSLSYILNKPQIANPNWDEENPNSLAYIQNKPVIPTLDGYATEQWVINQGYSKFSGDYNDLDNKPTIPAEQIQSDWNQSDSSAKDFIRNKPTIPVVTQEQADWNESDTESPAYIQNKPTIPEAQIQSDWNQSDDSQKDYIKNKPELFSGSYNDLTDKPDLFSGDYNDLSNKPTLFSGDYNDLSNKPDIPAAQIQADWQQSDSTQPDYIKNRPSMPSAQIQSDWNQENSNEVDYIKNKPTIPTIPSNVSAFNNDAQYITQEQVLAYKPYPSGWDVSDRMIDLIRDINVDANATVGKSYIDTVSVADLPDGLSQADVKVDVVSEIEGTGKILVFTVTSEDIAPYHWEYTSAYGNDGEWRSWVMNSELPTVNNATLTIKQGGTTKGTFTANASSNVEINLNDGGSDVNVVQTETDTGTKPLLLSTVQNSGDAGTADYSNSALFNARDNILTIIKEGEKGSSNKIDISGDGVLMSSRDDDESPYAEIENKIITSNGLIDAPVSNQSYLTYNNGNFSWDYLGVATANTNGLIKIGYNQNGRNYPVQLSNDKAYVNVPWENTTYTAGNNIQINGTTISATDTTYTGGEGVSISSDVVSQIAATNNTLGGIKLGYTKNDNKKPVQLDANNKAYVDTEQHLTIGGMITNGLSAHFYRVGTGSSAGSFTQNTWIPIIMSTSNNIGKCSVEFEILGREDGKTSYGKYYVNHMTNTTNKLLCLSFYSEDTDHFDYNDIRAAKYAIDNNNVTIVVYKKVRDVSDSMFIVNILAENTTYYSTQHYFYTGSSSISDANYLLTRTDLRIGTMNADTQSITAKLINDESASSITMNTIGATNATYYTTT